MCDDLGRVIEDSTADSSSHDFAKISVWRLASVFYLHYILHLLAGSLCWIETSGFTEDTLQRKCIIRKLKIAVSIQGAEDAWTREPDCHFGRLRCCVDSSCAYTSVTWSNGQHHVLGDFFSYDWSLRLANGSVICRDCMSESKDLLMPGGRSSRTCPTPRDVLPVAPLWVVRCCLPRRTQWNEGLLPFTRALPRGTSCSG